MLVIYKKMTISLGQFWEWIGEFTRTRHVDIISRDFNINVLGKSVAKLSSALTNTIKVIKELTYLFGSLIDYVYVHEYLLGNVNAEVIKFNVYFSEHDAI